MGPPPTDEPVRFHPTGDGGTRVELEHRAVRHGDAASTYRQAMASPEGWPFILDRYADGTGPPNPLL
jgi:uncharacterized protein YndB with AHSA1/START domain